jgi:hypothetical protein
MGVSHKLGLPVARALLVFDVRHEALALVTLAVAKLTV